MDKALVRLFTLRIQTGEFDDPAEQPYNKENYPMSLVESEAHQAFAVKTAEESIVLLKNDPYEGEPLLPLGKDVSKIVLMGESADKVLLGNYSGWPTEENCISPKQGLENYFAANDMDVEMISIPATLGQQYPGEHLKNFYKLELLDAEGKVLRTLMGNEAQEYVNCKPEMYALSDFLIMVFVMVSEAVT